MTDDPRRKRPDIGRVERPVSQCRACGNYVESEEYCAICRAGTRAERHKGIHVGYGWEDDGDA